MPVSGNIKLVTNHFCVLKWQLLTLRIGLEGVIGSLELPGLEDFEKVSNDALSAVLKRYAVTQNVM
jgi:hypothetical protein